MPKILVQLFGGGGGSSGGSRRYKDITNPIFRRKSQNRRYEDKKIGRTFEHHPAKPNKPGWEGKDHYHVENPNSTGDHDKYLDKNGDPCPKGSNRSHLTEKEYKELMEGDE